MNKTMIIATAVAVGLAMATPAKAGRILLQMLGEADSIGNLNDANAVAGTDVTSDDVYDVTGFNIEPEEFLCLMMPLLDPSTKVQLGSGIDCLYFISGDILDGVVAVSFFNLPGGSIVNAGRTSLGLFAPGVGDNPVVPGNPESPPPLLMTGSIPNLEFDSIVAANGGFAGYTGTGRVSGAVFPGAGTGEFPNFWFNCMWELNVAPNPRSANGLGRGHNQN